MTFSLRYNTSNDPYNPYNSYNLTYYIMFNINDSISLSLVVFITLKTNPMYIYIYNTDFQVLAVVGSISLSLVAFILPTAFHLALIHKAEVRRARDHQNISNKHRNRVGVGGRVSNRAPLPVRIINHLYI